MPEVEGKTPQIASEPATTAAPAAPPVKSLSDAYDIGAPVAVAASPDQPATTPGDPHPGIPAPPGEGASTLDRGSDGRFLPRTHRHPRALAEDAADLGMSAEDISATDTDTLAMTLRYMRRSAASDVRRAATFDQLDRTISQNQQADRTTVTQDPANPPAPETEAFDLPTGDEYDPRIRSLAQAVKHLLTENKQLKSQVSGVTGHLQNQAALSFREQADQAFQAHEDVLGKGGFDDLPADSHFLPRRRAVLDLASKDPKGTLAQKVTRAREALYGKPAAPAPVNGDGRPTPAEWGEAGLALPTQRGGAAEPDGPEKATKNLSRRMRDSAPAARTPTLANEFPD